MKIKSIFLVLFLSILLPNASNAQLGALKKAINKKLSHKVDTAIDKNVQKEIENNQNEESDKDRSDKPSDKDNSVGRGLARGLLGGNIDIKHNDEYVFTGRLYMQVETYEKKDSMKSDLYTYYNSSSVNSGMEVSAVDPKDGKTVMPAVFVFDHDNNCFMILSDNGESKTCIISTIPSDSALAAKAKSGKGETPKQPAITKTGDSRNIAGYKCDGYQIVDPEKEGYALVWMTKDIKLKADKRYWGKAGMPNYYGYPGLEGSVVLAVETFDKDNKPGMKMETKEINDNFHHAISTVGYTFIKLNFGQAGKK